MTLAPDRTGETAREGMGGEIVSSGEVKDALASQAEGLATVVDLGRGGPLEEGRPELETR